MLCAAEKAARSGKHGEDEEDESDDEEEDEDGEGEVAQRRRGATAAAAALDALCQARESLGDAEQQIKTFARSIQFDASEHHRVSERLKAVSAAAGVREDAACVDRAGRQYVASTFPLAALINRTLCKRATWLNVALPHTVVCCGGMPVRSPQVDKLMRAHNCRSTAQLLQAAKDADQRLQSFYEAEEHQVRICACVFPPQHANATACCLPCGTRPPE